MKYPGAELDNFDKAVIWRKYIFHHIKNSLANYYDCFLFSYIYPFVILIVYKKKPPASS